MLFRFFTIISINMLILIQSTHAQVDTTKLKLRVSQLQSTEDHMDFWQNLYDKDQTYRNVKTSKINDLENLISASIYLNKFGLDVLTSNTKADGALYSDMWNDYNDNGVFDTGDCYSEQPWLP